MDRITRSHLDSFRQEQTLGEMDEPDLFELFADFCVVADAYDDEFSVADVHVGGPDDLGLDGIAVIVNGALVTSVDEAQDLLAVNGYLDVQFVFVQAKSTSGFSGHEITSLFEGVEEFLRESPALPMSEAIANAHLLMAWLYDNSISFRRHKPSCLMAYVTTGQWKEDPYLKAKIAKGIEQLRSGGLFSDVAFLPMGADELHESYQRSKNSVTAEFTFATKVLLPEIEGVSEAYLGVVSAKEFLTLIRDRAGNIRKALFYDNVRDFQDYNAINGEIRQTLQDTGAQGRFAVLNNGVTLVTRGLRTTGNRFVLTDYQIVNGCQTSHVLYGERDALGDDVQIPLKVIATSDEDIINAIITATNRQTQVTAEDLYALSGFQKRLEAMFDAYPDKKKLHYERRSKQYSSMSGVEKVRIISKPQQIRAFAAMFLDEAHRASRYYSDLRAQVGTKIFNDQHRLETYYASAYAYYKLEYLFRNGLLPNYYKPPRYHLLMAVRYIVVGDQMPALTANKIDVECGKICDVVWSDELAVDTFREAMVAVYAALDGAVLTRDSVKVQTFTDSVKAAALDRYLRKTRVAPSGPPSKSRRTPPTVPRARSRPTVPPRPGTG